MNLNEKKELFFKKHCRDALFFQKTQSESAVNYHKDSMVLVDSHRKLYAILGCLESIQQCYDKTLVNGVPINESDILLPYETFDNQEAKGFSCVV